MDVLYDARAELNGRARYPSLSEWLVDFPSLGCTLDDCSARFLSSLSEESIRNPPKLCHQLQEAYWFYMDNVYQKDKKFMPKLNQSNFIMLMLEACERLSAIYTSQQHREELLSEWRKYMRTVPINGAVMVNKELTKCIMIQSYKGTSWNFPGGKLDPGEDDASCAAREVLEETGIDIKSAITPNEFLVSDLDSGHRCKLFLVADIEFSSSIRPTTFKEIGKIGWVELAKLLGWDGETDAKTRGRIFFGVKPFVDGIRRWVNMVRRSRGIAELVPDPPDREGRSLAARGPGRSRTRSLGPGFQHVPSGAAGGGAAAAAGAGQAVPAGRFRGRSPDAGARQPGLHGQHGRANSGRAQSGRATTGRANSVCPAEASQARGRQRKHSNSHQQREGSQSAEWVLKKKVYFALDTAKVMAAFDKGWDAGAGRRLG